ncbi:MAG: cupredoxin domain-containing protein [Polyangiaceae bacterium]
MNRSAVLFASLLLGSLVALGCGKADANAAPAAAGSGEPSAVAETATGRVVEIKVTDNGFEPKVVEAKKGETVSLKFIRSTKSECLKAISIPSLKINKDLPMETPVIVNVPADKEGKIVFQCWMAMVKGEIDVKG